jgi:hypothetical protein
VGALYHKLKTQSRAPEDGRNHRPKNVELIGIINKPLLLLFFPQPNSSKKYTGNIDIHAVEDND